MTRKRRSLLHAVALCVVLLAASGGACNVTIAPTSTIGLNISNAIASAPPNEEPFLVCLLPGSYSGCYNLTLATPSGAPVRISGAGSAETFINCSADEFGLFAYAPTSHSWLQGFKLSGCGTHEFPTSSSSYTSSPTSPYTLPTSPTSSETMRRASSGSSSSSYPDFSGVPSGVLTAAAGTNGTLVHDLDLRECSCAITFGFLNDSEASISNVSIGDDNNAGIAAMIVGIGSRLTLHRVSMENVFPVAFGGGPLVFAIDTDLDVIDCEFNNTFGFHSGAIAIMAFPGEGSSSFPPQQEVRSHVVNSTFNLVTGLLSGSIYSSGTGVEVSGCTFSGNRVSLFGGLTRFIPGLGGGAVSAIGSLLVSRNNVFMDGTGDGASAGIGGVASNITSVGDSFIYLVGYNGFTSSAPVSVLQGQLTVRRGVFVNCTNLSEYNYDDYEYASAVYASNVEDVVIEDCEFVRTVGDGCVIYVDGAPRARVSGSFFDGNTGFMQVFAITSIAFARVDSVEMHDNVFVNNSNFYSCVDVFSQSIDVNITNTLAIDDVAPGVWVARALGHVNVQGLTAFGRVSGAMIADNVVYINEGPNVTISEVYIRDCRVSDPLIYLSGASVAMPVRGGSCLKRGGCSSSSTTPVSFASLRDITVDNSDSWPFNGVVAISSNSLQVTVHDVTLINFGYIGVYAYDSNIVASNISMTSGRRGLEVRDGSLIVDNVTISDVYSRAMVATSNDVTATNVAVTDSVMDDYVFSVAGSSINLDGATVARVRGDSVLYGDDFTFARLYDLSVTDVSMNDDLVVTGCVFASLTGLTVTNSTGNTLIWSANAINVFLYNVHVTGGIVYISGFAPARSGVVVVMDNVTFTEVTCGTLLAAPDASTLDISNITVLGGDYGEIFNLAGNALTASNVTFAGVASSYLVRVYGFLSGTLSAFTSVDSEVGLGGFVLDSSMLSITDMYSVSPPPSPSATVVTLTDASSVIMERVYIDGGSATQPVRVTGPTFLTTNNVVLTAGYSPGDGGGIRCDADASCSLINVDITECVAGGIGGALACDSTTGCVLQDSLLANCSALSGGAIGLSGADGSSFSNVVIASSSANTNGGGLEVSSSDSVTLDSVTLRDCSATSGGGMSASAQGTSVTANDVVFDGNYASATGAAIMCLSEAAVAVANSQITDNWGSPAVYALFQATVAASDVVFTGNGDCVSAFGANNMTLDRVSLSSNTGTAIQSVSSPLYVTDSVIRDNSGAMAVRLASVLDAVFTRSYVAANAGVGLTCVTPKPNSAVVFDDSALCDNSPDWACDSDCNVVGVAGACTAANVTSCGDYCAATPEFCVRDGGVFVGPYDGCFACDGACYADEFNCTDNAECVDGASGSYECTCQSGFVGNGSVACVDIDECADGTDNCAVEAVCTNTPGSFDCACNSGYEGNGVVCTDVDECVNEAGNGTLCAGGAVCRNIVGGYECECDDRSYGDGYSVCNACPANTESFVGARNVSDCRCVAGFYDVEGHEGSGCIPCPRGYYVLFAGDEFVCIECPPDTYSTAVNTAGTCASCPAATTTNGVSGATSVNNCTCALGLTLVTTANVTQCERLCRVGEYRPTPTAPCYACAPGTYSGVLNAESCESCPRNSDSTVSGATTSANCTCNTGYFAPGGTTDEDCERWCGPGWARPDPFAIDCVACDSGEYSDSANQAACSACPENSVSDPLSTEIEDCSCPSGYYTPAQKTGTACLVCPTGATCAGGVAVPLARKGYTEVETGDDTAAFAECVPFEACEAKGECAEGYAGDQCQQCAARYYRLDGLCYKCKTNAGIIVFFCFFALLVFCAILVVFNSQERVLNKFASVVIGVNAFQIAAMYGRLDLDWPPLAQKFFSFLSFVNFNIELVSPECAVSVTDPFVLRWLMTMLFPAVVALMFAIIYAVGSLLMKLDCGLSHYEFSSNRLVAAVMDVDWSPRHLSHTCIRAFYQIMTIGYLPLSATVFEFFYCVRDLNGNKVISTSRQTACYTKTYWSLFPFALIWMFLYPIGIPLFCGFLLQTKRARLGIIKFNIRYGFLVGRFSEEYFYYELAVMGRKLGVALCMSFLTPNPYIRAGGAIVVLLVAYSAQLGLTPYRSNLYNWMENGCLFCSVAVLLISVVFQAHGAAEVTREVLVVGVLCAMLVIIAVGLGTDIIRMVREEREIEEQVGLERRFESSGSSAAQEGYMGSDGSHHVLQTAVISTDNAVWALDGSDASVIAAGVATTSGGGFSSGETSGADGTSGSRGGGGGSGGGVGGGMGVGTPDGPMSLLGASVGGESSYALESYPAILASGGSELGGGGVGSGGVGSLQSSGSEVSSDVNALVRQPTPQLALPPPLPDVTPASPTTAGSAAPQPSQQHLAMPPAKPPTTPRGAKPPPKVPRPAKAVPSKPPRPSPGSGGGGGSMVASELASLPLPDESMLSDLSSTPLA